ncbi:MAG: PKD domain-containing protein [Flavobacteriales bacterium]
MFPTKSFNVSVPTIGATDFEYSSFAFDNYNLLSIQDPIQFTNLSTGDIRKITWNFGDGSPTIHEENPTYTYTKEGFYTIIYTVEYEAGCTYFLERIVHITKGYILITPNSFTPNGDGYNDRMKPVHEGFSEIEMTIYTTWGATVYYEKSLNFMGWDGFIKGLPAENGNYVIVIKGLTFYKGEIIETLPFTLIK